MPGKGGRHHGVQTRTGPGTALGLEQVPRCDTPGRIATPGLLRGLSGIGMGLLRAVDPRAVAPVLTLGT